MLKMTDEPIELEMDDTKELGFVGYEYPASPSFAATVAKDILLEVMKFRRLAGPSCAVSPCADCLAPHLSKITSAVEQGQPIVFVLPAFPGKSPNPAKVLGHLPDMAEQRALEFLQQLCDRLATLHAPGARILLCSDGRVFSDVVGMRDDHVTVYQDELNRMILRLGLSSIATFNLEEQYEGLGFDEMRRQLMAEYGEPIEALKAAVGRGGKAENPSLDDKEAHGLYCGITRFLFEDALVPGQTKSRTAIQKEARVRAYEVIQRSKAWGELIEARFANAVRLSIHPQGCGSSKLGIRLIEPDNWQTPWHGVAVEMGGRFVLLKRAQAESLGARLVHEDGRPSHYVLAAETTLAQLQGFGHGIQKDTQ